MRSVKLIQSTIILLAAVFVAVPRFAHAASPSRHYYGGIDLGSSGTKGRVYFFANDKEDRRADVVFSKIRNTSLVSSKHDDKFSKEGIADAVDAVNEILGAMNNEAAKRKIQIEAFYIVGSSGVGNAANKQDLVTAVKSATGMDMQFVDAKTEGYYGLVSAVPLSRRATSIYIDIGSGNTKLGCIVGDVDIKNFKSLEIPYGSKSVVPEAKKRNHGDLLAGIASVVSDVSSTYDDQSQNTPCLRNRQFIYWTGGAAWATASFMHPEASLDSWVPITKHDLDTFIAELRDGTWNQKKLTFNFPKNVSLEERGAIRKQANIEINDSKNGVINVFTREQILSGVSILVAILNSSNQSAIIRFVRGGDFVYGFALDRFEENMGTTIRDKQ